MRGRLLKAFGFAGVAALSLASCTDTALVDRNVAIANRAWHYDNKAEVETHIVDTLALYDFYINLRHTPAYKYANIFVRLHQHGPDGRDTVERFELRLAEPDGRWLGRGSGSVYMHQQVVKENVRFTDTGTYVFAIEQNMRDNPLLEVTDVGIRIAPAHE